MKWGVALVLLLSTAGLAACGGGGGGGGPTTWYVDVATGSDGNPGTAEAPFRSITRALQSARTALAVGGGDIVSVRFGTYDDTVETFPLVIPPGVVVNGPTGTGAPWVQGGGPIPPTYGSGITAAVVLEAYATIHWFEITNTLTAGDPGFHYGLVMVGDQATADDCHPRDSLHGGIRVESGTNITIHGGSIAFHPTGIGLHFAGGGIGGRVQVMSISQNRIGVEYDAPGAALNGTTNQDTRVQIYGNSDTDVWVNPGVSVDARGCQWDHVPPDLSTTDVGGGIDIFHLDGLAGIDITGYGPLVFKPGSTDR